MFSALAELMQTVHRQPHQPVSVTSREQGGITGSDAELQQLRITTQQQNAGAAAGMGAPSGFPF